MHYLIFPEKVDRKESDKYTKNGRKTMANRHQRYTDEFKRQSVALYEGIDRIAASMEREYKLSRGRVWRWTNQYGAEPESEKAGCVIPREVRRQRQNASASWSGGMQ
jgi:transposase-like protein